MSEQFTKGSWVLFGYEIKVKVDFGEGWFPVCKVNVFNEAKANAALIACAPEMYEMLSLLLTNSTFNVEHPVFAEEVEKLLAKARGEA